MEQYNNKYKKEYHRSRDVEFFQCFSPNLSKFLEDNGVKPLITARHYISHCRMDIFLFDNENRLSALLQEWSDTNPYNNYD